MTGDDEEDDDDVESDALEEEVEPDEVEPVEADVGEPAAELVLDPVVLPEVEATGTPEATLEVEVFVPPTAMTP
ncbi:hypothetical protein FSW04_07235 [Baekduia soli]|uniref:Uncharacterized protein n=1 Tax=Baekduia soli TaxID=496014 RepID=A0A5B8U3H3_9ACTN|nr:hypothetical protein [Baekduia soli]QEC47395.1 hypothetical protein FSW04_07235 [Baekduia soli]